jgi:hypothetical protein
MSLNRVLKIAADKSYSGWDFNGDGRFPYDRVKGKDKRDRTKYQRTLEKRWMQKELQHN